MSFLKKLFAQEQLSPEQKERLEREKLEKRERRENEKEQRRIQKERKKEQEQQQMIRYFGSNTGFTAKTNYSIHKNTLKYLDTTVLSTNEEILATIPAEYDKTKKREIKGVLVATDQKLVFASVSFSGEYIETFDYKKMNGISLATDGLSTKELYIDYGRGRKKFDDIINDDYFKRFLNVVRAQIARAKTPSSNPSPRGNTAAKQADKYKQLEQLGKLRSQGILTEEEFLAEKQKILQQ